MRMFVAGAELLLLLLCAGCAAQVDETEAAHDFFFWTDGYIAAPVDSSYDIALTYYYEGETPELDPDDVSQINAVGLDAIQISITDTSSFIPDPAKSYRAYVYTLKFEFPETGVYTIDYLEFLLNDGDTVRYPIGTWVFDIAQGDVDSDSFTYASSIAASSSSEFLPYSLSGDFHLVKLYYGKEQYIAPSGSEFLPHEGKAVLDGLYAPVKTIRPKLEIEQNGQISIVYGSICYCGALEVDQEDIDAAKRYSEEMRAAGEKHTSKEPASDSIG